MTARPARGTEVWLLATTLVVAVAGLIYELIAATVSSYLLGDSVRQFSFVIGVFLSSMGVGAWVSRFVLDPVAGFVRAQIGLGLIGGFAALATFYAYATVGAVAVPLYGALIGVGVLSGMEIPLLARILAEIGAGRFRFENVLSVDYLGALVASLAFPVLIVPNLSLIAAGLAFGLLNLAVAGGTLWLFRARLGAWVALAWAASVAALTVALVWSGPVSGALNARLYEDEIVFDRRTAYQQVTVTRFRGRTRLYLDGAVQFDTIDEHRYHEPLVHPAMAQAPRRARILILGGGDGMAVREVLRWDGVQAVTLVDLDPEVTELFRDRDDLAALNGFSLRDARVTIVAADAFVWARDARGGVRRRDPRSAGPAQSVAVAALQRRVLSPAGPSPVRAGDRRDAGRVADVRGRRLLDRGGDDGAAFRHHAPITPTCRASASGGSSSARPTAWCRGRRSIHPTLHT